MNNKLDLQSEQAKFVLLECSRQWKENQEEEYGSWESQSDAQKAEYYSDMYNHLKETGELEDFNTVPETYEECVKASEKSSEKKAKKTDIDR